MKKTGLLISGGAAVLLAALAFSLLPRAAATSTAEAAPILLTASADYSDFSPDGDGDRDSVRVSYELSQRARVWARIVKDGSVVRTLRSGSFVAAGTNSFRWDGRNDSGAAAPSGTYQWVINAARGKDRVREWGNVILSRPAPPAPAPSGDRWVGSYVSQAPLDMTPVDQLEAKIGQKLTVINYFQDTSGGFTRTQATNVADHGAIPMVTLEFWRAGNGVNQSAYRFKTVTNGSWDEYLRQYARSAKAFGKPMYLRPFHEMNGNWYPWAGTANGNAPADFVPAWRHMRDIFNEEGATNVKFVWAPNNDNVPNTTDNAIARYWPGDAYVDYMAIDGYNFGTSQSWSSWRSFDSVFSKAYAAITPLSSKPIIIAETGCSPVGGDKAAWITDMFKAIPARYPRIAGVTWFNTNKETDWRIESSSASVAAFKTGAAGF